MKRICYVKYLFLFFIAFVFMDVSLINAVDKLEEASAPGRNPNDPPAGKITLYNDKVTFEYGYRVKDIKIWVCEEHLCNVDKPTIVPNQTYLGNSIIEFDISEHLLEQENKDVEYKITISANFKGKETDPNDSSATLNYLITIKSSNDDSGRDEDVFKNSEKALAFVNTWIIPGIYVALAIIFVVKAILLAIDLVRYSDYREVRNEKLKAFAYLFIGLLVVAIINSTVGIITGLFK